MISSSDPRWEVERGTNIMIVTDARREWNRGPTKEPAGTWTDQETDIKALLSCFDPALLLSSTIQIPCFAWLYRT